MAYKRKEPLLKRIKDYLDKASFNWEVRRGLYEHIAAQNSNGVQLETALEAYKARMVRNKRPTSVQIISKVSRAMRNGASFADALFPWIPIDEYNIIQSGELAGKLPKSLEMVAEVKQVVYRVIRSYKRALTTPFFYAVIVYVMLFIIGKFVIPDLSNILPEEKTTGLANSLYVLSNVANSYWVIIPPICAILITILVYYSLERWTGKYRIKAENKLMIYRSYRDINGFTWVMGFAALLEAGMPDIEIIQRQTKTATPWMAERLRTIAMRMGNGDSLDKALLMKGRNGMPPFGFPNPDLNDNIESFANFPDFPKKITASAQQWAKKLEEQMLDQSVSFGRKAEAVMYGIMTYLVMAIMVMSDQISTTASF